MSSLRKVGGFIGQGRSNEIHVDAIRPELDIDGASALLQNLLKMRCQVGPHVQQSQSEKHDLVGHILGMLRMSLRNCRFDHWVTTVYLIANEIKQLVFGGRMGRHNDCLVRCFAPSHAAYLAKHSVPHA